MTGFRVLLSACMAVAAGIVPAAEPVVRLDRAEGQPFSSALLQKGPNCAAIEPLANVSSFKSYVQKDLYYLNLTDWITLYDYLDADDVPLTLVQPSVERIPMVAGLAPSFQNFTMKCTVEKTVTTDPATPLPGQGYKQITTYTTKFKQDSFPNSAAVNALLAFPFKRGGDLNNGSSFKARAMMKLFLVASQAGDATVPLRGSGTLRNMRPKREEWEGPVQPFELKRGGDKCAVLTFLSAEKTLNLPNQVTEEEDAFVDPHGTLFTLTRPAISERVFFVRREVVQVSRSGVEMGERWVSWSFPEDVRPIMADGRLLPPCYGDEYLDWSIRPCAAVWFKIETDEGVVDYVPAVLNDDVELGGVDNAMLGAVGTARTNHGPEQDRGCEDVDAPLLRMTGSTALPIQGILNAATAGPAEFTDPNGQVQFSPKSFYSVDPRYNWAPEDWIGCSQAGVSFDTWKTEVLDKVLGKDGRAPDIFMSCSNQGWLQSMGELALLPRQTDDDGMTIHVADRFDGRPRTSVETIAHAATVWRTYPVDFAETNRVYRLHRLGVASMSATGAFDPYLAALSEFQTAFAGLPDWAPEGRTAFAGVRLAGDDLDWLATRVFEHVRANPLKTWEDAYDELWAGHQGEEADRLFDRKLADGRRLHSVDRKILYAIGRSYFKSSADCLVAVPSSVTGGAPVSVPRSWVGDELPTAFGQETPAVFGALYGSDLASALTAWNGKTDARGRPLRVWEDFVAGTDPTDPLSVLRAAVEMRDGAPCVSWSPDLNAGGRTNRIYTVWGASTPASSDWHTPVRPEDRFFKVSVSLP